MRHSGEEQGEPNAIGHIASADGLKWTKHGNNRVFRHDRESGWWNDRFTACQLNRQGDWPVMLSIGFRDEEQRPRTAKNTSPPRARGQPNCGELLARRLHGPRLEIRW